MGNQKLTEYKTSQDVDDTEYNSSQDSTMDHIVECKQYIAVLSDIKKTTITDHLKKKVSMNYYIFPICIFHKINIYISSLCFCL